jgi:alkanesulfonate monooxygenase SsuD/methylene tetrahydromethanopterin reductase-like flavin-dependent oxidoreductase (luciferase family)
MTMRHGVVILPEHSWRRAREVWRQAEEFGFDHAWTYDHLVWRWLRDKPWFGAVPTLAAAATATSRIGLGTLVASPGFRDPVSFAKEIMTLDDISGGRMNCGVGAGGYDADLLRAAPSSPADRSARFAEFVELMDRVLRQEPTSHHGRFYHCQDLVLQPACVQRPRVPLAVAASGPRGMRLAAAHADTWVTSGVANGFDLLPYEKAIPLIRDQVRALEEACAEIGRDPSTIGRLVLTGASIDGVLDSVESFRDCSGALADAGVTDLVVHWPRPEFPFKAQMDTFENIARWNEDHALPT